MKSFCSNFRNLYGESSPKFLEETFEGALQQSVLLPCSRRRPLFLYIHHNESPLIRSLCVGLSDTHIQDFFKNNNCVLWGWDFTHENQKESFLDKVGDNMDHSMYEIMDCLDYSDLPIILIITRVNGSYNMISQIHLNLNDWDLLSEFLNAMETFKALHMHTAHMERAIEQRRAIIEEQNAAYRASYEADLAKATALKEKEQKKKLEGLKRKLGEEAARKKERDLKRSFKKLLLEEPHENTTEEVCHFRFRTPTGDVIQRRFLTFSLLQVSSCLSL